MLAEILDRIEDADDRAKLEALYRAYWRLMLYAARKYCREPQDAEDAVHDACVALARHLDKIGDVDSPQTRDYVVTVTESRAIDLLRRNRSASRVPLDDDAPELAAEPPTESALDEALSRLPARYREALALKYRSGYSTREIAEILSITPKAVESLLYHARKALQRALEEVENA